jgi:VWFA-related protein
MQQRTRSDLFFVWAAVLLISPNISAQQEPTYTIRVNSDLVQISVVVRDHDARFVRDLTRDDFAVIEDGRLQQLSAVDLERVAGPHTAAAPLQPLQLPLLTSQASVPATAVRGFRLVVLFFDFTSLGPDDAARSLRAAEAYIRTIGPADRVAIVTLAAELEVWQDFTGDHSALQHALQRLHGLSRTVLEGNGNGSDDSTHEVFNGYQRLRSLRMLTSALAQVPQKKSVVILAGNTGSDSDLVAITATVDAAVRAGVSFYTVDATGLSAMPPLGDATQASSYGTTVLSGTAVAQGGGTIHEQDLLYALARGTGGRAFFDSNDFERPFRTLEEDTREYYMLSYRSSNSRRDGRYRRISVRVRRRGLELKHPAGYYGPRDESRASTRDTTERVLAEELAAELPASGLPVFGFVNHLRIGKDLFYVPITVVLPAEALLDNGIASSAAIGLTVVDGRGRLVRGLRDLIPTSVVTQHPTRAVQYETATELPAGEYNLRLVVVQNGTGQVGSFTTPVRLPVRDHSRISVSPLLSGTLAAASSNSPKSPLVLNGSRLILNPLAEYGVKWGFAIQYQVECGAATHDGEASCDARRIRSSLQCFSSDQRVFNAEPPATTVTADTAVFRVEFPAGSLQPGTYKCRVTAINPQCSAFAFGAAQLRIRDDLASSSSRAEGSEP